MAGEQGEGANEEEAGMRRRGMTGGTGSESEDEAGDDMAVTDRGVERALENEKDGEAAVLRARLKESDALVAGARFMERGVNADGSCA
jgi:hypothetical protein